MGTIRDERLSDEFQSYALAMYCHWQAFDAYHHAASAGCDYWAMRADAGCAGIDGAAVAEAPTVTTSGGWFDFAFGGGGDGDGGGGDGGGGDGGGGGD